MTKTRRSRRHAATANGEDDEDEANRGLPVDMRERNRAVAEREASRLARPERRKTVSLGHASRAKSAVTSTPFGYHAKAHASSTSKKGSLADDDNEWCGPFSVARQMIAKREEARRKREADQAEKNEPRHPLDDMVAELDMKQKRKEHPSLQWRGQLPEGQSSDENLYSKRQKRVRVQNQDRVKTPSLFQLCVDFVCSNFDHVEALGDGVDSSIRSAICKELVARCKMDAAAFDAIAERGIEALELVDCAEVTQDQLAKALKSLVPAGLRFLVLNHAGRCFGPQAVKAIISSTKDERASLFAVSIGGAYLLKDSDAASLVSFTAPNLSSIEFKACPLLGSEFCNSLINSFSSATRNCLLELSLEDLALTKESFLSLGSSEALHNLKSLSVRQCKAVDDEVVLQLLGAVGDDMESLDLSYNHDLTDECLNAIRRCNESGALRSLQLCGLKNLSAAGLEATFTHGIPGLPNPPMLRTFNVAGCQAVTDEVMDLVTKASSMKRQDEDDSPSTLSNMGGLVNVNITGSACTDKSMEYLASRASTSLKVLDVSFCPNVSDKGLGYFVSKAGNQLTKIHIWGCAQITDEFLDGHARVGDSHFAIEGAWMKKAGAKSLR